MNSRRARGKILGAALFSVSIIVFIIYSYFTLATSFGLVILKVTIVVAVGALLAVMAWIGYTMTTAPSSNENNKD